MENTGLRAADVAEDGCAVSKKTILVNYVGVLICVMAVLALMVTFMTYEYEYSRDSRLRSRLAPEYPVKNQYFWKSFQQNARVTS
jgi:hypothetical protein